MGSKDDYPAYCIEASARVVNDPGSLGIVIGGSGNGEQIAANKVKVVKVNTLNVKPKPKRVRQQPGLTRSWKKAMVTVAEGDTIELFAGN